MARHCRWIIAFLCFCSSFILSQCGGSSLQEGRLGKLPDSWGKYLQTGSISATLAVYDSSGKAALRQDLAVDINEGLVSAPQFKLPIGDTYRFIVIFNYNLSSTEAIPYAYADFTWLVDEFSESVEFSENDIRYGYDAQDPTISAAVSDGMIPNLDLDGDGWTNWEELRDKVNPRLASSVPILPVVTVSAIQEGTLTDATITVVAKDNAHVEELRMVDPACGITVLSDTLVQNVDGSVTRTLLVRLDLMSVANNSRTLQALAGDGVTPGQNATSVLNFSISDTVSRPYFVFTDPEENAELEGPTTFRGVACSRKPIRIDDVRFENSDIAATPWRAVEGQLGTYLQLSSEAVNTELLPDGLVDLKVIVKDQNNQEASGNQTFKVINDSPIRVLQPVGRRWIFGNEPISVSAVGINDASIMLVEGNLNFALDSSTATAATGNLDVSTLAEDTPVSLTFKVVRTDGSEIVRKVDFTVRNKPQVQIGAPKEVFRNWKTRLKFRSVNAEPGSFQLKKGEEVAFAPRNKQCRQDPVMSEIIVCDGDFEIKVNASNNYSFSASRPSRSEEKPCEADCLNQQTIPIIASANLENDIPEINVAISGDDEPEAPEVFKVPSSPANVDYNLLFTKLRDGTASFQAEVSSGETVVISGLEPRTDYLVTLDILNGEGAGSQMLKEVTTGDVGLMGWWRFKDDYLKVDCPGEGGFYTICDYSGRNNHGDPFVPGADWIKPDAGFWDGAMGFDGSSGYLYILSSASLQLGSGLTVSCLIDPNHTITTSSILTKDAPMPGPYTLDQTSADEIYFGVYTTNSGIGSWKAVIQNISYLLGVSFRVTGTYGSGKLKLYFNDQLKNEIFIVGSISNNNQPLYIGRSLYHNGYFSGVIDECLIFNREISGGEVATLD